LKYKIICKSSFLFVSLFHIFISGAPKQIGSRSDDFDWKSPEKW